eukprot:TRINITY_DN1816_c0_g1_i6.p1 TRINITY_DN1816_c0_g1~~TRINITY_DN1816_c0_g1_i6.p1  ORF type:complete len:686 (+),score=128.97 TRINITY_DN1816_c0_g1_i6:238-2295(+)
MSSENVWAWVVLCVCTAVNLTPLALSLTARWMVLNGKCASRCWQNLALLRVHNIVLAQVSISYLLGISTIFSKHLHDFDDCNSAVWWAHRTTSGLGQGLYFSGLFVCMCLLCSSDGPGAHCIRRALVTGAIMGLATFGCCMLQSISLSAISCSTATHQSSVLRNVTSSVRSALVFLSCLVMSVCYLWAASSPERLRVTRRLLVLLAVWCFALGGLSVAVEVVFWLDDLDTKVEAFTWTGLFHCNQRGCILTVCMWVVAVAQYVTMFFALRADGVYWTSLGLSVHADRSTMFDSFSKEPLDLKENQLLARSLLRQKLALDLHSFRTSAWSELPSGHKSSINRMGSASSRLSLLDEQECDLESGGLPSPLNKVQLGQLNIPFAQLALGQCIGRGANSRVFQGTFRSQPVAVKRFKLAKVDSKNIHRINKELVSTWLVSHGSVVGIHGFVVEPPYVLHVLELCSRGCLANVLFDPGTPRGLEFSLELAAGAAASVEHLHNFDPPFIHRDIKPNNYLVDEAWNVKLADFGDSAKLDQQSSSEELNQVVGTPLFMSPEIWSIWRHPDKGHGGYTEKVDVYSLAITLWVVVSRRAPYSQNQTPNSDGTLPSSPQSSPKLSLPKLGHMVCKGTRPEVYGAHWPARFCELLEQGWAHEATARPTAEQIVAGLHQIRAELKLSLIHISEPTRPY